MAPVKYLLNIFTTDCQLQTAEMAVVETLWQLHTLIVGNSWYTSISPVIMTIILVQHK